MFPPALMQLTVIYCPHHAQAVIIPIIKKESDREPVTEAVARLEAIAKQAGIRVKVGEGWDCGAVALAMQVGMGCELSVEECGGDPAIISSHPRYHQRLGHPSTL